LKQKNSTNKKGETFFDFVGHLEDSSRFEQQKKSMSINHHHATKESSASSEVFQYLLDHSVRDTPVLERCRRETQAHPLAVMQISPDEGQFLHFLVKATNAKRIIEVGVFTGYSSICVATALPEDGKLIALDLNEEFTNKAREYWQEAGVAHKVDLRLGPAVASLQAMLDAGEEGTYDIAFIDADKINYDAYYELCLRLLRKGGVIAVDNVLWSGKVADATVQDDDTNAIRKLNDKIFQDSRVTNAILTLSDGVSLCYKN
jgi:predicted O-methyltransferase YrrM